MSPRVVIALLASVALHVGVFAAFAKSHHASITNTAATPAPAEWISVDLAPRPPAPAAAPEPATTTAAPAQTSSRRPRAAPRPAVPSAASEPPDELVDVGLSAPAPQMGSNPGTGVPGAGGRGSSSAPGGDVQPPGSTGGGDARDLSQLHARLSAAAAHCYPASARRFRIRGQTDVSFCVGEDGSVSRVAQRKSSGSALLDRAAIECVLPRAAPLPGPPGCFTAPIVFDDPR